MRVVVRHFASLREARGVPREELEVPVGSTLVDVYRALGFPPTLRVGCARNGELVPADTPVSEGDELAFLPPLGGG